MSALPDKITARSASDRTDDWPYWFVTSPDHLLNITGPALLALGVDIGGKTLVSREFAEALANTWNDIAFDAPEAIQ